jgi:hypothetical protein
MVKPNKTIGLTIRLWTDGISPVKGQISPGNAWAGGMVRVQANPAHGLKAGEDVPFNRWAELVPAIEQALENSGVTLHIGSPASKLFTT